MLIQELIDKLKGYQAVYGDIEVEVFHAGYTYPTNLITGMSIPQNRRIVQIATIPVDWSEYYSERKDEKPGTETIRQEEIPLDADEN